MTSGVPVDGAMTPVGGDAPTCVDTPGSGDRAGAARSRTALPGRHVDAIRTGVDVGPGRSKSVATAVYSVLVSTAMSAQRHGWPFADWHVLVTESKSALGLQAGRRYDADGSWRPRPRVQVEKTLRKAWDAATENLGPAREGFTAATAGVRTAEARRIASDPEARFPDGRALNDTDRAVLNFAADEAERRGFVLLALPRRAIVVATGRGERAVRLAQNRLDRAGYLKLRELGRSSPEPGRRRATKYELLPGVRAGGPRAVPPPPGNTTMGPPAGEAAFMGPPSGNPASLDAVRHFMGPPSDERTATLRALVAGLTVDDLLALRQVLDEVTTVH